MEKCAGLGGVGDVEVEAINGTSCNGLRTESMFVLSTVLLHCTGAINKKKVFLLEKIVPM